MRTAAKRDANESEIVATLTQAGVKVISMSQPGIPDLYCVHKDKEAWLEVKGLHGSLTAVQQESFRKFPRHVHIVRSPEEALRIFGLNPDDKLKNMRDKGAV